MLIVEGKVKRWRKGKRTGENSKRSKLCKYGKKTFNTAAKFKLFIATMLIVNLNN